jgi:hypothetical protein
LPIGGEDEFATVFTPQAGRQCATVLQIFEIPKTR